MTDTFAVNRAQAGSSFAAAELTRVVVQDQVMEGLALEYLLDRAEAGQWA